MIFKNNLLILQNLIEIVRLIKLCRIYIPNFKKLKYLNKNLMPTQGKFASCIQLKF